MSGVFEKISSWFGSNESVKHVRCTESAVKEVIEAVINEIGLKRKVDNITYRPKHHWYIVRFFSPPSCIIPRQFIEAYLKTDGVKGKAEIVEILSVKQKGFELI
ncbi:MAG: hypothetical protein K9L86_03295 [Candidatus Omnitrophica bacterium]|nr:hypothetical protein [Candidatus Omnitrophota bacterium]